LIEEYFIIILQTVCIREVLVVVKHDTILKVAALMRKDHTGDLVMVEDRNGSPRYPIGIVTDRAIVIELITKDIAIDAVAVGDLACRELVLAQGDDMLDAIQLMRQKGVRRLRVVDKSGALIGEEQAQEERYRSMDY
jgi:CBS domain-containing protein